MSDPATLCQVCGQPNREDEEYCRHCHHKLLVVSGPAGVEEEAFEEVDEESFSFDEHLLERISILEEAVKRTADTVRQLLGALRKQERSILVNQTGVATVREMLEESDLLDPDDWSARWQSKMDYQMLALEKRERFTAVRERIAALHHGEDRDTFLDYLEEAEYALYAFEVGDAMQALEAAFALDPDNYELACFLGETYFNEGLPERALGCFERVLEVNADHYQGLVFCGVLNHDLGDDARAEEYLKRAIAIYPETFLPNFSLGAIYATDGQLSRAVAFLERAVEIEALPQAHFLLGRCYYEMGKPTASIRQLKAAVRADPAFEEAHHLLGLACLDRGWTRKALASFRTAQQLNPKKLAYHDLVRYLTGHGDRPLPEVPGEAGQLLVEAEEQLARENLNRAQATYQRALALEPDHPTVLMAYALLCLRLDRSQEIVALTRKVLAAEPGEMLEATAYATLIAALRSQGKYREGNALGRRLLDEERSSFTRTIAYYEMAYNLAEMEEDLDRALDYARRSLELAPEELKQFPLAALGWVHYKRREYDRAVDYLTRSSELGSSATTLTHLGMALLAAGEEEPARDVLERARSLSDRGEALEEKMMAFLKDSSQLLERVRRQRKK